MCVNQVQPVIARSSIRTPLGRRRENQRPTEGAGKQARHVRARKVISRSRGRVTGKFASMKMGATIYWESQLERDAIMLMEIDPAVSAYYEQPFTLEYRHEGEIHHYTPDLLVEFGDGKQLIEVKPDEEAESPANQERFALLTRLFLEHGYVYRILPEREIRIQPRLDNTKLLLRYRRVVVSDVTRERLRRQLAAHYKLPIKWFTDRPELGIGLPQIASLLCYGYLATDMNAPIGPDTPVWIRG